MSKDYYKLSLSRHLKLKGKLTIKAKDKLDSLDKLSIYYTPGMAAVSSLIAKDPKAVRDYTWVNNNIAVISDGSAVMGLGNIGPEAALPVMEGKAMIFKDFAGIDAIPIILNVHTEDEIVAVVEAIAPSFGGINLEDIAAPLCFKVEERLKKSLAIPVFHDDQHGTAIVTLAGLINASVVAGKDLKRSKVVIVGAGAAGTAIANLLHLYSPSCQIIMVDSKGIIARSRKDLNDEKRKLLKVTNLDNKNGDLSAALTGADIFIGVSTGGLLKSAHIKLMNKKPIIFGMANPNPEILPDEAYKAGAAVVATGRSDFPNQVNNSIAFPGIFRGALDNKVRLITNKHKIAAAKAIASLVKKPTKNHIIPSALDKRVVKAIAKVIN